MKKKSIALLVLAVMFIFITSFAHGQSSDGLELGLNRDFGYAGFGNDIQGIFTMKIRNAPEDLVRVVFLIDSSPMGEDDQPPFSIQFNTDSYPHGNHSLSAIGYTSDGRELTSNAIQILFVAAGSGMGTVVKIVVPLFVLILVIGLLSVFLPLLLDKGKFATLPPGTPRKYGIGGGAICPKCSRPFPLRLWWINLGFKKIDRCPYCGKWSFVRPSSHTELRAAEAAEITQSKQDNLVSGESEADKFIKNLDDSRYQDM
jgi:hypothetical protein